MLFRPRIFVSSTFKENEDVRVKIKDILQNSGAEPLLYETALTPSVLPRTYRQNVLDSDFVLLILKNNYGTKTPSGLSGTHEEYKIAKLGNKPMHVYIYKPVEEPIEEPVEDDNNSGKNDRKNQDLTKFLNELDSDGVSYYFYKTEEDLLKRIQETTFTIAKEIMIYSIDKMELADSDVARIGVKKDYDKAIKIFKVINKALDYNRHVEIDFVSTTLFLEMFNQIEFEFAKKENVFIDSQLNDSFKKLHDFANNISSMISNNSSSEKYMGKINLENEQTNLFSSKYSDANAAEEVTKLVKEFFGKYEEFRMLVQEHKTFIDINY